MVRCALAERIPMLFSTTLFLFVFLPLAVLFYQMAPKTARNMAILLTSVVFYAWGEPRFVFVVLISALIDYSLAKYIARGGVWTRACLALGIAENLGLLFVFKYADFALRGIQPLVGEVPFLGPVSPRRTSGTISSLSSCSRRCWRVRSSNIAISHRRCESDQSPWTISCSVSAVSSGGWGRRS